MTSAAEIIRAAAKSADPEAALREAGWTLKPPDPPPTAPTVESFYRFNVHTIAAERHGWTGGSIPDQLLTDAEQADCRAAAEASHAYHVRRIAGATSQ